METNVEDVPDIQGTKALIINQSGLQVGNALSGEIASQAVSSIWRLGNFSDIRIIQEQVENGLRVIIKVDILPSINSIEFENFKEYQR